MKTSKTNKQLPEDHFLSEPTTDSKEGLHTQGEWEVWESNNLFYIREHFSGEIIADLPDKANAELIVKAVNERQALLDENTELKKQVKDLSDSAIVDMVVNNKQALLDSHKELLNLLIAYKNMVGNTGYSIVKDEAKYLYSKAQTAINNAKNITP